MKMKIIIWAVLAIILGGFVISQVTVPLPPNFQINILPLPLQQSAQQLLFNCPYGNFSLVDVKVWGTGLATANATVTLTSGKCQQSLGYKEFSAVGITSTQVVSSFQNSINQYMQTEALSNHQPNTPQLPISTGGAS